VSLANTFGMMFLADYEPHFYLRLVQDSANHL
jgi:hypothetical protein